jgi:hypothetical protein
MIMDCVRSCYTVNMQFDAAGEIVVPVTWYFTSPGALTFPGPHRFGSSHTWAPHSLPSIGLGERWDSKPSYANGAQPFYAPGSGSFCGPLDWFAEGCPSDAPPVQYSSAGVPVCCPQPPCQPWFPATIPSSTVQTVPPGGTYHLVTYDFFAALFNNGPGTIQIEVELEAVECDMASPYSTVMFVTFVLVDDSEWEYFLQSYDPSTHTGLWTPDPAAPVGYLPITFKMDP